MNRIKHCDFGLLFINVIIIIIIIVLILFCRCNNHCYYYNSCSCCVYCCICYCFYEVNSDFSFVLFCSFSNMTFIYLFVLLFFVLFLPPCVLSSFGFCLSHFSSVHSFYSLLISRLEPHFLTSFCLQPTFIFCHFVFSNVMSFPSLRSNASDLRCLSCRCRARLRAGRRRHVFWPRGGGRG